MPGSESMETGAYARESVEGQSQKAVSELAVQAGGGDWKPKWESVGRARETRRRDKTGWVETMWVPGTHLLLVAADPGCGADAGGGSVGLTPAFPLIVPKGSK